MLRKMLSFQIAAVVVGLSAAGGLLAITPEHGAGYDGWALEPVASGDLPKINGHQTAESGIDYFVRQKLQAQGLDLSPEADRRPLIRRLTFDLLGLPPDPAEVARFVADDRPDAYERLVDRLLASPHYGIRWARHGLDVVRFGESQGFERDKIRDDAWPYRDWVIDALNRDMPYDEFVRHQIAGDVLCPGDPQATIATGFLVAGPYDEVGQTQQSAAMQAVVRQDELEDIVSVVGQTFLGLTVNCARCHDHKFDPIPQREYFQLAAALDGVRHGQRELIWGTDREGLDRLKPKTVYAVAPKEPGVSHLLVRGEPAAKSDVVAPGGVASVKGVNADFGLPPDAPDALRRIRLADWITDSHNALFARVIANRIWHYHFGRGLVETPNDFGLNGSRPSHPRLIDYLARRLIRDQWSLKRLHRLMVTSATWRQASRSVPQAAARDADNQLLWRKSPMRLEAEALRDATLSVAGMLNHEMAGPGFRDFTTFVDNTQFYEMTDPSGAQFNRRSIFRTWIRSGRNQFLDAFDCPDPSTKTPNRAVTVTPLQALTLMNNSFMLRMSDHFAERIRQEVGDDVQRQITCCFQKAFGRLPQASELQWGQDFVSRFGLAELCRVVFNSNEFLFVD